MKNPHEIHDELGQWLTALNLEAILFRKMIHNEEKAMLRGELLIESNKPRGTIVVLRVPLTPLPANISR
ncbi:MAG: hypothetical protein WDO15_21530 [Bacteroidota bacterium]